PLRRNKPVSPQIGHSTLYCPQPKEVEIHGLDLEGHRRRIPRRQSAQQHGCRLSVAPPEEHKECKGCQQQRPSDELIRKPPPGSRLGADCSWRAGLSRLRCGHARRTQEEESKPHEGDNREEPPQPGPPS